MPLRALLKCLWYDNEHVLPSGTRMQTTATRKEIEISQKIIFTKHDAIYIADPSSMQDTRHI